MFTRNTATIASIAESSATPQAQEYNFRPCEIFGPEENWPITLTREFTIVVEHALSTSEDIYRAFGGEALNHGLIEYGSVIDGTFANFDLTNSDLLANMRALFSELMHMVSTFIEIPMKDYPQDVKDWNLHRRTGGLIEFRNAMWGAKTCIAADLSIFKAMAEGETPLGRTMRPRIEANSRFHNLGGAPNLPMLLQQLSLVIPPLPERAAPNPSELLLTESDSVDSEDSDASTIKRTASFDGEVIDWSLLPRSSSLQPTPITPTSCAPDTQAEELSQSPTSPAPSLRRELRRIGDHVRERENREMDSPGRTTQQLRRRLVSMPSIRRRAVHFFKRDPRADANKAKTEPLQHTETPIVRRKLIVSGPHRSARTRNPPRPNGPADGYIPLL
jgi:hypothetical protein